LDDEPIESLLPTLEELLGDVDQNKQRAAAELLAGVIGGKMKTQQQRHNLTVNAQGRNTGP
jgi:hypothetical protein